MNPPSIDIPKLNSAKHGFVLLWTSTFGFFGQWRSILACASHNAADTNRFFKLYTILPSKRNSLAVACNNHPGSYSLFINTTDILFTWTAINCANLIMLGGTFLFLKSNFSFLCFWLLLPTLHSDPPAFCSFVGMTFLFMSLLILISLIMKDSNFVTSELKKLLLIQTSSICYFCKKE